MATHNIKYLNDIDLWQCDCPIPRWRIARLHKRLGRAMVIKECCMASKVGGGSPTVDGVAVTEFMDVYEFTHGRAEIDALGVEVVAEFVVADHPWDADEVSVVVNAVPAERNAAGKVVARAQKEITKKKGDPPRWLWKRLAEKGLYKALP